MRLPDDCPTCGASFYKAKIARTAEWLADRFRERPEWPSDELIERAKAAGVSGAVLVQARRLMLVSVKPVADEHGKRSWVWVAPKAIA